MAACVWVAGFLICFFAQVLPNNSTSPDTPLTRLDICRAIFVDFTTLLNPFDYSTNAEDSAGWHNLRQRLPYLIVAGFLILCAWATGRLMTLRMNAVSNLLRSERLIVELGTGLSVLSLWILLCGVAGFLTKTFIALPVLSLVAVFLRRRPATGDSVAAFVAANARTEHHSRSGRWLLLFVVPFALHIVLGGMTPPFDFDVREYHLQGPKEWFQAGRITHLDHNVYTSFPFLSEMFSLGAMVLHGDWWHGAIAGKLTLTVFQFGSALTAYAIGRRWFGVMSGLISAIAVLSTPWTVRISIIAYAEGAASFYLIAGVMTALLAGAMIDEKARQEFWMLTGFFAGSAMAAKYPGVLSAVIPCGLFLLGTTFFNTSNAESSNASGRAGRTFRYACLFALAVLCAVGPWLIKNAVTTGNPVYPLAYSVFGGDNWSAEMDTKWKAAHSPDDHNLRGIPANLWDVAAKSDWQSGLLFALAVPSIFLIGRFTPLRWIWLHVLWILATWWAFTHRIDRFWVPVIPLVAILAGSAWQISESRFWRILVQTTVVVCCIYNYGFSRLPVIGFHAGLADMQSLRKQPVRSDISILNRTLPQNARVLMVGEAEVFDMNFDLVYNTVFDECIFELWTTREGQGDVSPGERRMKSADEIRSVLRQNRITHVYINWSEILRYRLTYGYTDYVFPKRFEDLQAQHVLSQATAISAGEWSALSEQQRTEILSWPGGQRLMLDGGYWSSIQLYKVE